MSFFVGLRNVATVEWYQCADLAVSTDAVSLPDAPSKGDVFETIVQNSGSHDVRVRLDGEAASAGEGYVLFAGANKSFAVDPSKLSFCSADGSDSTVVVIVGGINLAA